MRQISCETSFDVHGRSVVASAVIKDLSQRGVQVKISYESKMALEVKDFPRGQHWL